MYRLRNGVQNYSWGSPDAIPRFLGERPDGTPVAEVWIGTHALQPSTVVDPAGEATALSELSGDLPFMLKVLAADQPLSLQVHPSKSQAEDGYADEERAGIPLDAPNRVYKDANHKPEMVYALTTFDSLIGFRPTVEILRVLAPLETPLTQRLAEDLRADPGFAGIVRRVEWLLSSEVSAAQVGEVVGACRALGKLGMDIKRAYSTAVEIAEHYPDDVGVVISLMLNRMTLQPGEAAYLGAGIIHAHLKGLCLEVMASSDNVLRAGLTKKHVDPRGLVTCLGTTGMARIARVNPEFVLADTEVFSPADVEFALAVTQVSHAEPEGVAVVDAKQSLLICTGGEVEVRNGAGERVALARGESVYLGPDDHECVVVGLGEVAQAFEPARRAVHSRLVDVV
ncbi:mannose-6-phosphate isomerase, class I [Nocardioides zeae]|uniref:mannose-6-phosphate isomerase n=1 Tax=Nocardioides imazamoxiresistens TaxID=3231893 RepID=A0ABU3PV07_9ACTN|nr:mannose-6-phosphate isomerase, class I [Nocardioides zeae]MDT9593065.1 mannose-6-phosphate isomerase, class I [Nocardioides zeae]